MLAPPPPTAVAHPGPVYVVTGESKLPEDALSAELRVHRTIGGLPDVPSLFVTGGAQGVDTIAALAALATFPPPETRHVVVFPGAPWNDALLGVVGLEFVGTDPVFLSSGTLDLSATYMARNDRMLEVAGPEATLLAYPRSGDEVLRSGTWATVRRARERGLEVRVFPLLPPVPA